MRLISRTTGSVVSVSDEQGAALLTSADWQSLDDTNTVDVESDAGDAGDDVETETPDETPGTDDGDVEAPATSKGGKGKGGGARGGAGREDLW